MDLDEKLIEMSRSGLFWRLGMGWQTWMEEKGGGTGAEACIYEKGESENEIWQAAGQARTSQVRALESKRCKHSFCNHNLARAFKLLRN